LFKQAVTLAKRAHSETAIAENPVSVSYAAVELAKRIFGDFRQKTVMIIGAGKMSELTVKHLHANGAARIIVVNRTLPRAGQLAAKFHGEACVLENMDTVLPEVDIVISSTGASELVLSREQVESIMLKRKSKPLFLIDIAVPRDLEPSIGTLSNVFLYDIDDLETMVKNNLNERCKEAEIIEAMIKDEIEQFEQWYRMLGVGPVIRSLQDKGSLIHEETMESLLNKLPELDARQITVIRKLTKSIVNQMMRDPIMRIKELSATRAGDESLEMFTKLFALEQMLEQQQAIETVQKEQRKEHEASTNALSYIAVQP
jgi:glutamyl-tRNA reductase